MKKTKNLIKTAIISSIFALGVGLINYKSSTVTRVEASQYLGDYDPYTYSGHYYDTIDFDAATGMNGALRQSLTTLIRPAGFYTYGSQGETHLATQLQYADEDPTNSNNMVYLYTRDSVTKNAASSWNREHCWPQSLSNGNWGTSEGGTDILHLRPTYGSTNSSRGNTPYGNANKATAKYYNSMLYGYTGNGYFEPIDSVKGDVARIIMYVWTTYTGYKSYSALNILSVFQSYDTLLTWHTQDKPDLLEGNRNDYCQTSRQQNRNPFVDHPELAWKIFGDNASDNVKNACMQAYPANGSGGNPIEPTGIRLNKSSASIEAGKTLQLSATLQPNGATGSVSWSSNNTNIALVNSNGLVTAVSEGNTTITATVGGYSANCNITVTEAVNDYGTLENPLNITDAKEIIDRTGNSETAQPLYVRGIVSSNTAYNAQYSNHDAVWLQSDDGSVSESFKLGRVKLDQSILGDYSAENSMQNYEVIAYGYGQKYNGTYELWTSSNTPKNPLILSINPPTATAISLNRYSAEIGVGETVTLTASLTPANSTSPYTWESSDVSVATVNNGVVTGVSAGTVTIVARVSDDVEAECEILVKRPSTSSLIATLRFTGNTNTTCANYSGDDLTEILNLDSNIFAVTYNKNGASTEMALRTDGIRMYATKQTSNGNKITVSITNSYSIKEININFDSADYGATAVISTPASNNIAAVDGVYSINNTSFTIFNDNSGVATNQQVRFQSITITYEIPSIESSINGLPTKSSLAYSYTKEGDGATDTLNKTFTDISGNSYTDWSNKTGTSGVIYAGNSYAGSAYIQLNVNNSNPGVITTANPNEYNASKVTIQWGSTTTTGRSVYVYGSNEPYSSTADLFDGATQGTLLATLSKNANNDDSIYNFAASYKYIGIRSSSGALYIDSLIIQWGEPTTYTYSNVVLRFGGLISKTLWDELDEVQGYGVMFSTAEYIGNNSITSRYATARTGTESINAAIAEICDGTNIKNGYTSLSEEKRTPTLAKAEDKNNAVEDYYIWNWRKAVSTEELTKGFVAVAYIRTETEIVFFTEITVSAKSAATSLLASNAYDEESLDGSLYNLANMA